MRLSITRADGSARLVTVYSITRGLAVQRETHPRGRHRPISWGVLHIPSSTRVAAGLETRAAARYVQEQLLALDIDWTHKATKGWLKQVIKAAGPVVQACALHQPWRDA